VPISPRLKRYDQVLLDLDGTVWLGDEAIDGAPEAVAALREAGKAIAFLTNDVRHAPEEFVRRLWGFGIQAALSEVVSVGAAVQFALAQRGGGAAYVVGSQALVDHVAEAGMRIANRTEFATRADVVVVGGHDRLDFEELKSATPGVLGGAEVIGATRDATFPMPDGPWPGTGAVLAAIETAAGRKADRVIGKPEPPMYEAARDRLGEGRCLAIGDRLDVDVAGARHAGMDSALVLSGSTSRAQANAADPKPTYVADSLNEVVLG
jgi:glycerol 3-phosphatase-2